MAAFLLLDHHSEDKFGLLLTADHSFSVQEEMRIEPILYKQSDRNLPTIHNFTGKIRNTLKIDILAQK